MKKKLSVQVQGSIPGWLPEHVRLGRMEYVKLIDPPDQNPFSNCKVIGRAYMPDGESNALVRQGAAGAVAWFEKWRAYFASRPWVWAWEGPNEPNPLHDTEMMIGLRDFTIKASDLMKGSGFRFVGMLWSTGQPQLEMFGPPPRVKMLGPAVQRLYDNGHYLGLHEYSAPCMWDGEGYLCGRWPNAVKELQAAGYQVPPILITECGIDGGVLKPPQWGKGWRTFCEGNEDAYMNQLKWYDQKMSLDGNVLAATIFVVAPNNDWRDFEVTESLSAKLVAYLREKTSILEQPLAKHHKITATFADHQNRTPPSLSPGVDFATPVGTEALSMADGLIIAVGTSVASGKYVQAVYPVNGVWYVATYRHLSNWVARRWWEVKTGQVVGLTGNTGKVTGPHLHVDVMVSGRYVDPQGLW